MRLKIVQAGEPVLRQPARPLSVEEICMPAMRELVAHMRETMRDAPGVGLAAPQVGLAIQLAVIEDRAEYLAAIAPETLAERERSAVPFFALFNPRIVAYSEDTVDFFEGCLSVAGFSALVRRSLGVTVEYLDEQAEPRRLEAAGWFARILQHEIDHLGGALYLDSMETRTFSSIENLTRHWKDLPVSAVRDKLGITDR
ncbi:MAG TPA: peptide deformylase [Bryobacteraceae bacterium]|nr:peptide deformylase [Bryobacteraceae bacterium]